MELEFMRLQDGFRAKSQMQGILIWKNGTGSAAFCRRMPCLPSDRDGLLMHKHYRGDLYEADNIYCNRILSGENRGRKEDIRSAENGATLTIPYRKFFLCDGCFENDVTVLPLRQNTVQEVAP